MINIYFDMDGVQTVYYKDEIVEDMMKRKGVFVRYDYLIPMTEGGLMTFWLKSK